MTNKDHGHPDEDDQVEENDQQDGDQERTKEHSRVLVETAAQREYKGVWSQKIEQYMEECNRKLHSESSSAHATN